MADCLMPHTGHATPAREAGLVRLMDAERWDDGWRSCGTVRAEYEYVTFEDVPLGRLYWLENRSRGEEEMPFVLDGEGRQRFIYYDLVGM